jgi:hypothetical protein
MSETPAQLHDRLIRLDQQYRTDPLSPLHHDNRCPCTQGPTMTTIPNPIRTRCLPSTRAMCCEGADPETPVGECHGACVTELLIEDEDGSIEWMPMCQYHADLTQDAARPSTPPPAPTYRLMDIECLADWLEYTDEEGIDPTPDLFLAHLDSTIADAGYDLADLPSLGWMADVLLSNDGWFTPDRWPAFLAAGRQLQARWGTNITR